MLLLPYETFGASFVTPNGPTDNVNSVVQSLVLIIEQKLIPQGA